MKNNGLTHLTLLNKIIILLFLKIDSFYKVKNNVSLNVYVTFAVLWILKALFLLFAL